MPTLAPPRTSGDEREDAAITAGRKARAILDAAEIAILAAMARALRQVAAGTLTSGLASRQVRMLTAARLGAASRALAPLTASLPDDGRQRIAAAILRAQVNAQQQFARALLLADAASATGFAFAVRRQFTGAPAAQDSPLAQAQQVMDALADSGLTAFTDTGGRDWDLGSYVTMAVRAGTSRNLLAHAIAAMAAEHFLIAGPTGGATCKKCRPYAGEVLTLEQMNEATAEGLYHINCRHWPQPYEPGMDRAPYLRPAPGPREYSAQQRANYQRRQALTARRRAAVQLGHRGAPARAS